jgi:hypothetical protein
MSIFIIVSDRQFLLRRKPSSAGVVPSRAEDKTDAAEAEVRIGNVPHCCNAPLAAGSRVRKKAFLLA